jgi:hypothetical protein
MKDAGWWERSRVAQLAIKHGPTGPAVLDWLSCHAKAINEGGYLKSGYGAVAKGICALVEPDGNYSGNYSTPADVVAPVVAFAVEIGALDDYVQLDEDRFTCRISGWAEDQKRGLKSAQNESYQAGLSESK